MPEAQPIDQVHDPRYLFVEGSLRTTVKVGTPPTVQERNFPNVRMEVYTGWVSPFSVFQPFDGQEIRTFLPVSEGVIRVYQREGLISATATASPAIVEPKEGEPTLFGVAFVDSVQLEPQSQLAGDPLCLVLRIEHVGQNVKIERIAYQVTCLVNPEQGFGKTLSLPGNTAPQSQ